MTSSRRRRRDGSRTGGVEFEQICMDGGLFVGARWYMGARGPRHIFSLFGSLDFWCAGNFRSHQLVQRSEMLVVPVIIIL